MHQPRLPVRVLPACLAGILAACSPQGTPPSQDAGSQSAPPILDLRGGPDPQAPAMAAPAPDAAAAAGIAPDTATGAPEGITTLEWDALIPADFRPDKLLADLDLDNLSDDDPLAQAAMDKIRALWDQAPIRTELDGLTIRLPGFVVPVEADADETTGFLLVPYYGACIHVPPPPANQTVYVVAQPGKGASSELFEIVWVTGTMSVNRIDNEIAEAGYTIYATDVAPYE